MPGIAAVAALAALAGGGWSGGHPEGAAPGPELRITTTVTPDPLTAGGESIHTVTVTNTGGRDAEGATITDTLAPGTAAGLLPGGCSLADRTVTCGGPDLTIPAGRSVTYEIPVMVDPSLPDGTTVSTRAHVTAPHTPGDTTQVISRIRSMADVEIATTGPAAVQEGDGIAYTVTVTNKGPSPAVDVTVQHPVERTTVTGRPAECPGGGPTLTCPLGTLAPRERRTLTFTAAPAATGPIGNCATVVTGTREENTANNRSCTSTAVEPIRPTPEPSPSRVHTHTVTPTEEPAPVRASGQPGQAGDGPREPRPASATEGPGEGPGGGEAPVEHEPLDPAEPVAAPAKAGAPPPQPVRETIPMAGVSQWLIGLGVPVLLAVGLLVRYLSRREQEETTP